MAQPQLDVTKVRLASSVIVTVQAVHRPALQHALQPSTVLWHPSTMYLSFSNFGG